MKTPKELAIEIAAGKNICAIAELQKMFGIKFKYMTQEQRAFGVTVLSAFDGEWHNAKY